MGILDAPPRQVPLLVKPTGLRRWRGTLADSYNTPAVISAFGDSITEGRFANVITSDGSGLATDAAAQALWRDYSWVAQLRRMFQRQYGDIGEGSIKLAAAASNFDPRITYSGSFANSTVGPQGGLSFTSPSYLEFALPACTSIEIFYSWIIGVNNPWTYTIDGGSPVTVGPEVSNALFSTVITGLAYAPHTLRITGPATLRADIGTVCGYKASAGVQVNRFGTGGALVGALGGLTPTNLVSAAQFTAPRAKLNILMWGYNDWANQVGYGSGLGDNPTTYKAKLKVATDYIAGTSGGCTLLIPDPYGTATGAARPFAQTDYTAKMRELAVENDHIAFVDFNTMWGTYETQQAAGLRADFVHPNRQGMGDIARLVYSVLTRPDLG